MQIGRAASADLYVVQPLNGEDLHFGLDIAGTDWSNVTGRSATGSIVRAIYHHLIAGLILFGITCNRQRQTVLGQKHHILTRIDPAAASHSAMAIDRTVNR
jgi:hypothetical protein